ncbi:MAG TPA: carboxypeptidase-like regulatory domain-containing protein, partial [Thermoleophilia bacterium]|nr:carboxypeptidase-like regulatory domain-containing protein [Thermoleophilia bacterium]
RREYAMGEKVTYKDLPKKFVAGTVVLGDVDEVAIGAEVALAGDGVSLAMKTNGFGDFEFEGLADATTYTVTVEAPGYAPATLSAKTHRDIYLGEIVLEK